MKNLLYPIRAVSKLTGISIDTLRAWERRHQVVTPQRDDRGRLYTEADVQRLRLLNTAVERGHAIGRVAELSDKELQSLIAIPEVGGGAALTTPFSAAAARPVRVKETVELSRLVIGAIERLDYAVAERELSRLAAVLAPREFIHSVALPLMRQIGEAWHAGGLGVAQEHMASSLLRNLLGALIPLYRRTSANGTLLFATPAGEQHEFGILLAAMLAAGGGLGIVYLGANLPADEIIGAARRTAPQALVLGFIGASGASAGEREIQQIAHLLPSQIELWVGGTPEEALIKELKKTRALLIGDFHLLERHLVRLGARF